MPSIPSNKPYRVGRSRTGLGLFATKPIKKGTKIIRYFGPLLDSRKKKDDAIENKYLFELNNRWTIDGSVRKNVARYINHACKPNAESDVSARKRKVVIRAIKRIEPGEEINYDYGTDYFKAYLKPIGCKCVACEKKRKKKRAEERAEKLRLKAKAEKKALRRAEKEAAKAARAKKRKTKVVAESAAKAVSKSTAKSAGKARPAQKKKPVEKAKSVRSKVAKSAKTASGKPVAKKKASAKKTLVQKSAKSRAPKRLNVKRPAAKTKPAEDILASVPAAENIMPASTAPATPVIESQPTSADQVAAAA